MRYSFLLLALLAVGCQTRSTQENTPATTIRTAPDADLRETRWELRQLGSKPVVTPANTAAPYLLLRTSGAAEGNGSCNSIRGAFISEKLGDLTFSPLSSTRMACPAMSTEGEFIQLLGQIRTYRISGDTLRLMDAGQVPLMRLEAVH